MLLRALQLLSYTVLKKTHTFFEVLKKAGKFEWTNACNSSFEELKRYLASPPVMCKPKLGEMLLLDLAISDYAVSEVLVREVKGRQHPVYYVSRIMAKAEKR